MLARVFVACVVSTVLGLMPASGAPATFQAGEDAYVALHFVEARAAYQTAAANGAPKDRADSLRQLGVMAWRIDGKPAEAEHYFNDAVAAGADLSATQAERERFLISERRFDEASAAAEAAVAAASTPIERHHATLAYAHSILHKLRGTGIGAETPADLQHLARARDLLRAVSATPPLPLDLSEALLEVALRLDDGPLALTAWLSYAREGADAGAWGVAAQKLRPALPSWRKGASANVRNDVFEGLRTSQFFALAGMVASDARFGDAGAFIKSPRVAETIAYAQSIKDMQETTDSYYRDLANNRADRGGWQKALSAIGQTLWSKLPFQAAAPAYSDEALGRELRARFGAVLNIGETGGVGDMHYAHVFLDDKRTIEQYGHRATLRLIALDRLVSNGYESWVWDGRQAHGGWANEDGIHQVRPLYADDALRAWDRLTDAKQRAEIEAQIAQRLAGDDAIAKQDAAAFLPGLATRVKWAGENAVLDDLRRAGVTGADLKQRFIITLNRITLDSSIFAHEGRHALDALAFGDKLDSEELEFRAKLSEIAFSEYPRAHFGGILNPNMANASSPHGRANKRIAKGLVAWMDTHRAAIGGLDATRPLLPQFDKLTDDQMRAAMRSMDPWAPK